MYWCSMKQADETSRLVSKHPRGTYFGAPARLQVQCPVINSIKKVSSGRP